MCYQFTYNFPQISTNYAATLVMIGLQSFSCSCWRTLLSEPNIARTLPGPSSQFPSPD